MAFTSTPTIAVEKTEQIPFIGTINARNALNDTDQNFINCYPEFEVHKATGEQEVNIIKRNGFDDIYTLTNIKRIYYYAQYQKLFVFYGSDLKVYNTYVGGTLDYTVTNVFPGGISGGLYLTEYRTIAGTLYLVAMAFGVTAGQYVLVQIAPATGAVTTCADADFPATSNLADVVSLDGYIFILNTGKDSIYASDLDNPMSWGTTNIISADIVGDYSRRLFKVNNYLVLFGKNSIEFFWDVGNPTGTVLQRNDTYVKLDTVNAGFATLGSKVFFTGTEVGGSLDVLMLEDFKVTPIGTNFIKKVLARTNISRQTGAIITMNGHTFYVLTLVEILPDSSGTYNYFTFAFDVATGQWIQFKDTNNKALAIYDATTTSSLSMNSAETALYGNSTTYFICNERTNDISADSITKVRQFKENVWQDNSTNFTTTITTDPLDWGSYNQKTMSRLVIRADRPSATSNLSVSYTDDDYQTFNTPRTVNLNQELPSLVRLGRFRRRAFKFTYTDQYPLRLRAAEVDFKVGRI